MAAQVIKCTQCNIVINELLCFTQNKIDVMDEESLIRIIVSAFSGAEINEAKNLLFNSVSTTTRNISRRKNKEQKDIEDIICLFKSTDPDKTPIFVARELQKLPPVTFDHVDVTRLLKDIVLLQSEIRNIKETYATIDYVNELKTNGDAGCNQSINKNCDLSSQQLQNVIFTQDLCVERALSDNGVTLNEEARRASQEVPPPSAGVCAKVQNLSTAHARADVDVLKATNIISKEQNITKQNLNENISQDI
ncbi:hypothetical protein B5X24_HaOG209951 [Helicoverpa armigera]|uniref:Mutant cadherin n=1 Tax=Helicoverpa armigera TaxID=29058 RepID=A0A2W1BD40_HELAM|nr:hypothetical protein B5X24_HaOG209951 [Helicoverpa armigera]